MIEEFFYDLLNRQILGDPAAAQLVVQKWDEGDLDFFVRLVREWQAQDVPFKCRYPESGILRAKANELRLAAGGITPTWAAVVEAAGLAGVSRTHLKRLRWDAMLMKLPNRRPGRKKK